MIEQVKDGVVVAQYITPTEASKASGVKATNITKVCKGIRRQAGGYEWRYIDGEANLFFKVVENHGDYKQLRETTYKRNIEEGTLEINTYYDHPPEPEEVIRDHKIDLKKWRLNGYWSKGKDKGWLVSANFLMNNGADAAGISEEDVERVVKKYITSPSPRIYRPANAIGAKVLRVILTDTHIGMEINANGTGMYGGAWNAEELFYRADILLEKVAEQTRLHGVFSEVHLINLGDLHDGLMGETARKGHALPQNMSDEDGYEIGVDFLMKLIDGCREIVGAPVKVYNVTNDNHSPLMGYIICSTVQKICQAKYNDVEVVLMRSYINHYKVGKHVFLLCHGKDASHLKFGFKPQLDDRGKDKIEEYMKHYKINGQESFVTFEKGDSHLQLLDSASSDDFHYNNYMAFSPASGWVQHNFKKSRSGFNLMVIDPHKDERTLTPYYFPWTS